MAVSQICPYILSIILRQTPRATLFPYTTLFRSEERQRARLYRQTYRLRHPDRHQRGAGVLSARDDVDDTSDRKSTRLNSSHVKISYAVFCLKKKKQNNLIRRKYERAL